MEAIAAISTAPGVGGIGIIRMSGKDCFKVLEKFFIMKNDQKTEEINGYRIKYGYIVNPKNKEKIDEVLVSYFKEPNSYTTENMCEINSHGGIVITKKILEICLENGAELAEAGEFTKRAFLNGRIDLSQAEAIIDVINSKTEKESKAAINQLEGFLSQEIREIREEILSVLVDIAAIIDYPEYDIEETSNKKILEVLSSVKEKIEKLEKTFYNGKIIKEGINVAIIGRPNAGKSSLLNAILREERAIVTEYEGTTRDTIEEYIEIEGIPLKIIDTAGIRNTKDEVEKIGIERAKDIGAKADLVIAIFDSNKELTKEDEEILEFIKDKKSIIVLNKIDLNNGNVKESKSIKETNKKIIKISAIKKKGIQEIYEEIIQMFNMKEINLNDGVLVTNVRHKKLIGEALESAKKAIQTIEENFPVDIVAIEIKEILENLGEITGDNVSENIINEIFAKFCLGK